MTEQTNSIKPGDLVSFIQGEASKNVAQSVVANAEQLAEANDLAYLDALLSGSLSQANCPESITLIDIAGGLTKANATVAAHIDVCQHCQQELAILQTEIVAEHVPDVSVQPSWLQQLLASGRQILFALQQSTELPQLALRGSEPIELAFEAESHQLLIQLVPLPAQTWQIEGQLVNTEDPLAKQQGTVNLYVDEVVVASAELTHFGNFQLAAADATHGTLYVPRPGDGGIVASFSIPSQ